MSLLQVAMCQALHMPHLIVCGGGSTTLKVLWLAGWLAGWPHLQGWDACEGLRGVWRLLALLQCCCLSHNLLQLQSKTQQHRCSTRTTRHVS
jgi:hypothetical protein